MQAQSSNDRMAGAAQDAHLVHSAVKSGDLEAVARFVQQNPALMRCRGGVYNWTLLHAAVAYEHLNVVNYLLMHGADTSASDLDNDTPLHLACRHDDADTLKVLLKHGGKPRGNGYNGYTPLITAAVLDSDRAVWLLLTFTDEDGGVDLDAMDDDGFTALNRAVISGRGPNVRLLLEAGADPVVGQNDLSSLARASMQQPLRSLFEDWECVYRVTKARRLCDAALSMYAGTASSASHPPPFLTSRIVNKDGLPLVETMVDVGSEDSDAQESSRCRGHKMWSTVLTHVLERLSVELFTEMMALA